jgi:hypothetical protein
MAGRIDALRPCSRSQAAQSVGERQDTALGAVYRMPLMLGVRSAPPRCRRSCGIGGPGPDADHGGGGVAVIGAGPLARSGQVAGGEGADLDASGAVGPRSERAG